MPGYEMRISDWISDVCSSDLRGIRVHKGLNDTAPFVDRIFYAPILALGAYFSLSRIFYTKGAARCIAIAASLLLIFNLSFSGGRAGMVMFAAQIGRA